MQDQQQNVLAARVTVVLTAALGAATGLLLGCLLAIPLAENRLKTYMERVAVQDDASLTEARSALDTLGHSANPTCSDADLGNLRDLVFGSDYLKDAGRIRGGKIECSATAGRPERPISEFKRGKAQADGTIIYGNLAPARDQNLRRTGIQRGNVFVVFGSHLPELGGRLPIRLATEPYQAGTPASREAKSEPSSDPATDEVEQREARSLLPIVRRLCRTASSHRWTLTMRDAWNPSSLARQWRSRGASPAFSWALLFAASTAAAFRCNSN